MNITVFLGAPGSGKGTQAKKLAQDKGFFHFSTGDMLRAEIKKGTELGTKARAYIDKGELVPDTVMIELIEDSLLRVRRDGNVLLDGFPRTLAQAKALDSKQSTSVGLSILFEVPETLLIERLTGRRSCSQCAEPYHIVFIPPKVSGLCDKCGGKLTQRTDDTEDVVKRRLEVFKRQNDELLHYYASKKNLARIDANRSVNDIQQELSHVIEQWYTLNHSVN
ncbi:MAG: adenylate kinase [Deltaproteobacteria bacterium]|nr:adenylate kinase [Deltaproteobacteria bacterium]